MIDRCKTVWLLACLALTSGCIARPAWKDPLVATQGLVRIFSPSDTAGIGAVLACWKKLEQVVAAGPLRRLAGTEETLDVFLFETEAAWREWYGIDEPGSLFAALRSRPVATYNTRERYAVLSPIARRAARELDLEAQITIRHELFHHMHYTVAAQRPERWLGEGLAELFGGRDPSSTAHRFLDAVGNPNYTPIERYVERLDWSSLLDEILGSSSLSRQQYSAAFLLCDALLGSEKVQAGFCDLVLDRACPDDLEGLAEVLECAPEDIVAALQARCLHYLLDPGGQERPIRLRDPLRSLVVTPPLGPFLEELERRGDLLFLARWWTQDLREDPGFEHLFAE